MMVFQVSQLLKVSRVSKALVFSVFMLATLNAPIQSHAQSHTNDRTSHIRDEIQRLHDARVLNPRGREPLLLLNGMDTGNNPYLRRIMEIERIHGKGVSEGVGYNREIEPTFTEVKFFKPEDARTINERIDKLLHGITIMLPPKYDLYGYELRRYMSKIAGPEVLGDKERLKEEILNTQRANIILEHWDKNIRTEIKALEDIIENDDTISSSTREQFKFNKGKARAFLVEAHSWVDNNQKMVEMLFQLSGRYEYAEPAFNFGDRETLNKFKNIYRARQTSVEIIRGYAPFRMMIY